MSNETKPFSDPLIEEVRTRRRELWAELGGDFERVREVIERRQAEHPEKLIDRRRQPVPSTSAQG